MILIIQFGLLVRTYFDKYEYRLDNKFYWRENAKNIYSFSLKIFLTINSSSGLVNPIILF